MSCWEEIERFMVVVEALMDRVQESKEPRGPPGKSEVGATIQRFQPPLPGTPPCASKFYVIGTRQPPFADAVPRNVQFWSFRLEEARTDNSQNFHESINFLDVGRCRNAGQTYLRESG